MKHLPILILSVVFTAVGLASGYFAARPKTEAPAAGGGEAKEHEKEKPKLSAQTVKNLGVTIADAEKTTFVKYRSVPAVIAEMPTSQHPVFAPVGGRVQEIRIAPGMIAAPGAVLVTILRDPIARPALALTEEILKPAREDIHRDSGELRKAIRSVELLKTELERVKNFTGTTDGIAVLPKKNEIDLRYDLARAEQELSNARLELAAHGFSEAQIAAAGEGKPVPTMSSAVWKQALERNGLWPATAASIFEALPAETREIPWNVAVLGELSAAGLASNELAAWLKQDANAGKHFLEIASLLQQGSSLASVKALNAHGALEPLIEVKAMSGDDWDVHDLNVKAGEKVEAGAKLLTLEDSRRIWLKTQPVGGETAAILKALEKNDELTAMPLVEGAAPPLKGLRVTYVTSDEQSAGTVAFVQAANEPLHVRDGGADGKFRSWKLREGQKYSLRIPTEKLDSVYVFPSDAVTDDGPDKVVFIQDGDSFKSVKVEIAYQDHEVVVVPINKDTEIFPGDPVVQHGAFGLGMAMKPQAGGGDDDDGGGEHHHHHHHH